MGGFPSVFPVISCVTQFRKHGLRCEDTYTDHSACTDVEQEGIAVASIARDDPSTLPGDDPFPRARMHLDRNAR